ncbi:MAG: hypothetical protein ACRDD7_04325 [Peptostreptococcaceae bacterium]
MKRRFERITLVSKDLSKEAFKAYSGKKDYKRAIQLYALLAESLCVPDDISNFAKSMMIRLSKKIEENT